jgi:RNA recognition motif-containing protein
LYIKNLASEEPQKAFNEIYEAFSKFGNVFSIKLHISENKTIKEYAYIQFDNKDSAEAARIKLNNP